MNEQGTIAPARRLGRGLTALLGGGAPAYDETEREVPSQLREIPIDSITRNPFQPRKEFDPEALGELASSIREHGVLQPLLVREIGDGFQLIAGERRWQASRKAGLTSVPCRVVDVVDKTACEFALEENLKRKDLNDLEKAEAFRDYLAHFECTIEELARQLSMNRSTVSNMLRLLELPDPVKQALHSGRISAGHARALLPLPLEQQLELSGRIQAEQLSVRVTEATVKKLLGRDQAAPCSNGEPTHDPMAIPGTDSAPVADCSPVVDGQAPAEGHCWSEQSSVDGESPNILPMEGDDHRTAHVNSLEGQLRDLLGVHVQIRLDSKESGHILVPFASNDEFERILHTLRRSAA